MSAPVLSPEVEYCLIHFGIILQDFDLGWITACESQELGYVYRMKDQFDHPKAHSVADVVLSAIALRERIATAIAQDCTIHLG